MEKGLEHKAKNPAKKTRYQIKQEEKRKNEELKHKQFNARNADFTRHRCVCTDNRNYWKDFWNIRESIRGIYKGSNVRNIFLNNRRLIMRKPAKMLGEKYGLKSQEMNYILKEEGYLSGDTGEYAVTDKGSPFAEEKDFHCGTGGYAHYNPFWTTRTWDESIENELNVTADMKEAARNAVAKARRQHWNDIKAARAEADAAFLKRNEQNDENDNASDESSEDDSNLLIAGLIIGGLIVLGYGVYKAVPHVVKWWEDSVTPKLTGKKAEKNMICPSCGDTLKTDDKTAVWKCEKCNYSISEKALSNGEVFWFCDKCEAFMNTQKGFDPESGHCTCSKCGFDNDVTGANINE